MRSDISKPEVLFHEALQLPPEARAAFLNQGCGHDAALRKRVEALLTAHEQALGFLPGETHGERIATVLSEQQPLEEPGLLIGRYKLVQRLGEGGFGAVWLAEQREPVRRKVALKIIKLGMDTRQVVARFEAERQALALMDHPNIAKVLDAGTTDNGRPYFVMELVRGIAITRFCDESRLTPRERLELFARVCRAVQHAHQKGIIHRDLKPSNILVTLHDGVPVPKVIDFGIAKATQQELTDKTIHTQFQQFIGTPAYMSPEQAEMSGLDIDTRSDIYSLGVLLYELLTGKTPFDGNDLLLSGLDEMRRTIREKEPPRPSTRLSSLSGEEQTTTARCRGVDPARLHSALRGDLDWIVMKCLEKDRTRRYETANGVALDIERHLRNEPILARPPSNVYRLQKLVRRNRMIVLSSGALLLMLLLGVVISTHQAIRASLAEREQRRARAEEARLREQADIARLHAVQASREAEKNLYAADMLLAYDALSKGNLGRLRDLLSRHAAAGRIGTTQTVGTATWRGWEWRYLWGQARGEERGILRGHSLAAPAVVFLDDSIAVSCGFDGKLCFWDVPNGVLVAEVPCSHRPRRVAVTPDGRRLIAAGDRTVWTLWDTVSRTLLLTRTNATLVFGVAASSDNTTMAVMDGENIELWNVLEKRPMEKFRRVSTAPVTGGFVAGLAFSPDGRRLAYGNGRRQIIIRDLSSGTSTILGEITAADPLTLAFSPDGRTVASGDVNRITLWDVAEQTATRHLTNHLEQIVCVAFSPSGRLLASASGDQTVRLWNTADGQEIATLRGHEHEVHSVAFSPDGRLLVSSGKDATVRVWEVERPVHTRERWIWPRRVHLPPQSSYAQRCYVEQADRLTFHILDLARLERRSSQRLPANLSLERSWAVGRNATLLAVASTNGAVELWGTLPLSKRTEVAPSRYAATEVALAERAPWLAVQRPDGTTELWNCDTNGLVQTFPALPTQVVSENHYHGLSFWGGDRCLVRATGKDSALLDIRFLPEGTNQLIRLTHKDDIAQFAMSDDGKLLATAAWDGTVKLWNASNGRELQTYRGQLIGFSGLAFSPDASRLAVGGWDGSIALWDLTSHLQVGSWKAHGMGCIFLAFLESGRTLVSGGWNHRQGGEFETRIWRAPSWQEIDAAQSGVR